MTKSYIKKRRKLSPQYKQFLNQQKQEKEEEQMIQTKLNRVYQAIVDSGRAEEIKQAIRENTHGNVVNIPNNIGEFIMDIVKNVK